MKRVRAPGFGLLFFLALGTACAAEPIRPQPSLAARLPVSAFTPGAVRYVGRFDESDPSGPRFAWSESGVAVRFKGTRLDVKMKDPSGLNAFQIVVDGAPTTIVATSATKDTYTVASGLPDAEHEVLLVKRTEARVGEVQLLGLAPDGALLPPPPAPARRIELIGDSITAGYGNEGANERCHFSPGTENAYMTYGPLAARALGAEAAIVAWSGKTVDGMSELYDRALPNRAESRWDPQAQVPDVVVINLGTNDLTRGDHEYAFMQGLGKLVDRVRANYPKALIVLALGPMLTDNWPAGKQMLTRARVGVRGAVAAKQKAGDSRVVYLEFPTHDGATGYGCDFHPSLKTHQMMADRLASLIKAEMAW
jgi:lysophospholipase L1-like esterase